MKFARLFLEDEEKDRVTLEATVSEPSDPYRETDLYIRTSHEGVILTLEQARKLGEFLAQFLRDAAEVKK